MASALFQEVSGTWADGRESTDTHRHIYVSTIERAEIAIVRYRWQTCVIHVKTGSYPWMLRARDGKLDRIDRK
jgi:hypothetical protein